MNLIFTIPNIVSFSRLILIYPIVSAILNTQLFQVILFGSIAVFSDFVDGYLSRRLNQRSRLGQVIDPIVDGLLVTSVLYTLMIKSLIPMWYVSLIFYRYLVIVCLLTVYRYLSNETPKSILSGKWSMCGIALTITTALFQEQLPFFFQATLLLSTSLLLASLLDYVHNYCWSTKN